MKREDFISITEEHFKTCERLIKQNGHCYNNIFCEECPFNFMNAVNGKFCIENWSCDNEDTIISAKEFLKFKGEDI